MLLHRSVRPVRLFPLAALAALIALAAILPYLRTFDVPFQFDDRGNIVDDPRVHALGLSPGSLAPALEGFPLHRWLARLTLAMNHAVGGLEPAGYHAVNLAIHVLAALAVFALALEILWWTENGEPVERRRRIAFVAAILFAVHPLQTMAVTYAVQRMASLAALSSLAALLCWARARRPDTRHGPAWFLAAGGAAFLGLSSKENVAVLPLLVLAFEAFVVPGFVERLRRRRLPIALGGGAAVALVAAGLVAYRAAIEREAIISGIPTCERLLTQPRVLLLYLGKLALPWPGWLHLDYGLEPSRGLLDPPTTLAAWLLLGGIVALAVATRRRAPLVPFAVAFFLGALAVEQTVLPLDLVFEHRVYLPSFGPLLLVARGLDGALARFRAGPWPAVLPLVAALGVGTVARNETWRDPVRLNEQDAAAFPRSTRPLLTLSVFYLDRGELAKAEEALRRVIALDSQDAFALSNLSNVARSRGDLAGAAAWARRSVEAGPRCSDCWFNLGSHLLAAGEADPALAAFRRAVALEPLHVAARVNAGVALSKLGRTPEALSELQQAVATDASYPLGWSNLAATLLSLGRAEEALGPAERSVTLAPDVARGRVILGDVLDVLGRREEAVVQWRRAAQLDPSSRASERLQGPAGE